jgi:hypothetical protein
MEGSPGSSVTHVHESQKLYYVGCGNQFLVFPDGKTIIGVEDQDSYKLFMEDITRNDNTAYRQIAEHENTIFTVLYNPVSKTLIGGDKDGRVVQYEEGANKETWTMVKDYGDLGIGWIISMDQIGDILIFGGYESYSIKALDIGNKKLLPGTLKTATRNVFCLRFCELPEKKVFLSVCGEYPNYSNEKTDIYDATELARRFNFDFQGMVGDTLNTPLLREDTFTKSFLEQTESETENETLNVTSCGCNHKIYMDIILSKVEEYLSLFRNIISSDFDQRLKKILSISVFML